jgi:hypothetical protein
MSAGEGPAVGDSPDVEGRFFLSPLPLGGTYVVVASCGHNTQVSDSVRLDGANPTERVVLRFSNLSDEAWQLNDRTGLRCIAGTPRIFSPDQSPPIEIRATLPSWIT